MIYQGIWVTLVFRRIWSKTQSWENIPNKQVQILISQHNIQTMTRIRRPPKTQPLVALFWKTWQLSKNLLCQRQSLFSWSTMRIFILSWVDLRFNKNQTNFHGTILFILRSKECVVTFLKKWLRCSKTIRIALSYLDLILS